MIDDAIWCLRMVHQRWLALTKSDLSPSSLNCFVALASWFCRQTRRYLNIPDTSWVLTWNGYVQLQKPHDRYHGEHMLFLFSVVFGRVLSEFITVAKKSLSICPASIGPTWGQHESSGTAGIATRMVNHMLTDIDDRSQLRYGSCAKGPCKEM